MNYGIVFSSFAHRRSKVIRQVLAIQWRKRQIQGLNFTSSTFNVLRYELIELLELCIQYLMFVKYYSVHYNLFVWFNLARLFKKVKKTFESCSLKLKIRKMYQSAFESCGLKHVESQKRTKKESKTKQIETELLVFLYLCSDLYENYTSHLVAFKSLVVWSVLIRVGLEYHVLCCWQFFPIQKKEDIMRQYRIRYPLNDFCLLN